jgi:hypothetical protein
LNFLKKGKLLRINKFSTCAQYFPTTNSPLVILIQEFAVYGNVVDKSSLMESKFFCKFSLWRKKMGVVALVLLVQLWLACTTFAKCPSSLQYSATLHNISITHAGIDRWALLHVPSGYHHTNEYILCLPKFQL